MEIVIAAQIPLGNMPFRPFSDVISIPVSSMNVRLTWNSAGGKNLGSSELSGTMISGGKFCSDAVHSFECSVLWTVTSSGPADDNPSKTQTRSWKALIPLLSFNLGFSLCMISRAIDIGDSVLFIDKCVPSGGDEGRGSSSGGGGGGGTTTLVLLFLADNFNIELFWGITGNGGGGGGGGGGGAIRGCFIFGLAWSFHPAF